MKINFTSIESLKEFKGKVLVSVVSQNFVENYVKKNGICECETNCKCGEICLCEKNPLQQAVYDSDFKGKNYQIATVSSSFGKIIFFGVGEADKEKSKLTGYAECRCQSAGHSLFKALKNLKISGKISILYNTLIEKDKITFPKKSEEVLDFAEGFLLSSYEFTKYMSKDKAKDKANPFTEINFITNEKEAAKTFKEREIITNNVFLCRDLINEPANILYPESYTKLITKEFEKLGVEIEVLDEKQLKKLGAGALLSVGQGSANPSYLVSLKYNGGGKEAPIAFVGKGVCFDSGGLSLKPSASMEMKCDMSGSAVVVSLIKCLAERKAKVNAVGVVALVENMPSGTATRIQDIVKSMSGQTIEILNTDAEGRMILADALYYTITKFKPQTVIDLATLTGAICISLGERYAGLFTNNDDLQKELQEASRAVQEPVWRMPLNEIGVGYDKLIDSDWADMKNIGGRDAGSITAAQFLQRFINNHTKWAHLDIAATAYVSKSIYFVDKGATGWGVRLLNNLVKNSYEKVKK